VKLVAGPNPFFFRRQEGSGSRRPYRSIAVIVLTDTVGATFGFLMTPVQRLCSTTGHRAGTGLVKNQLGTSCRGRLGRAVPVT